MRDFAAHLRSVKYLTFLIGVLSLSFFFGGVGFLTTKRLRIFVVLLNFRAAAVNSSRICGAYFSVRRHLYRS